MPPQSLPPLVHVSSLTTALKKLGIKVTIEEIIKVIEEEKTAKNTAAEAMAKVTQVTRAQRRAAMAKLALQWTERSKPENAQPSVEERRHRLLESTKEAFPDGKIPNLFTTVLLMRSSNDANDDNLPFIRVESIVVTSPTGDDSHQTIFNDVWCLWDTGAQVSYVVSDLLDPYVRDNESAGCATMEIKFWNVRQRIESIIYFRPELPNGVRFIILGQHALLDRLEYLVRPVVINPQPLQDIPQAYGEISLISWHDNVTDELVAL